MEITDIILLASATWYISFCAVLLPGPLGIFAIMRTWRVSSVMRCIYCFSFWVGIVLYLFMKEGQSDIVYIFGVVGIAHLFASYTGANFVQEQG